MVKTSPLPNSFLFMVLAFVLGPAARTVLAQELDNRTRELVRQATGQVAFGAKVTGEDKVEVRGWGSGWFVNPSGLFITNNHVVDPSHYSQNPTEAFQRRNEIGIPQYRITLNGGREDEKTYKADLLYQNESADLAILQVHDDDSMPLTAPHFLRMASSQDVQLGDKVWVFGYPHGQKMATTREKHAPVYISTGNITEIERAPSGRIKKYMCDAQSAGGNSGGPVLNDDGDVIGVLVSGGADVTVSTGVAGGQVPSDVVKDFVRAALALNKIDSDLAPFVDLLYNKAGRVFVPGRKRDARQCEVEFPDGEVTRGKLLDERLTVQTPLGTLNIPIHLVGYAYNDAGKATMLLDGGDRLSADAGSISLNIDTVRGRSTMQMSNLKSVLFPASNRDLTPPDKRVLSIEGDGCEILLENIDGDIRFKDDERGSASMQINEIRKIQTKSYRQVVHRIDGSRLTGEFEPHVLKATMVWSEEPVTFTLQKLKKANFRSVNPAKIHEPISLAERLNIDDRELVRVADLLELNQLEEVDPLLQKLLDRDVYKSKSRPVRDQITVLNAQYLLRKGNYEEAADEFKSVRRSDISSVQWYGLSRYHVLDEYPDGTYKGGQLSDPKVFLTCSSDMTNGILARVNEIISAHGKTTISDFRDWESLDRKLQREEDELLIANNLMPGEAEDDLFRMWRFRQDRNFKTLIMLFTEMQQLVLEIETRNGTGKSSARQQRELRKLQKQQTEVFQEYRKLRMMMNPIDPGGPGYRLDDPNALSILEHNRGW